MPLSTQKNKFTVLDLTKFSMLGTIMFLSKIIMQWIPSIHLLAMFIAAFTLTYRIKALIPLYIYIFIDGIFAGFAMWWLPYLYIWAPLWGAVMLVSELKLPHDVQVVALMIVCGFHGLSFGTMYAPSQALMYGLSFKATIAWISFGLPFDIVHGIGDFFAASLVIPLCTLLKKIDNESKYTK